MNTRASVIVLLLLGLCLTSIRCQAASPDAAEKKRFIVVSSYSRDYLWSQDTHKGFCAAMTTYGYIENAEQVEEFGKKDLIETSRAVIKKIWMDAKRKTTKAELKKAAVEITQEIKAFKPDLIFLGDDEAGNYIGNQFLDTAIPMVFWGFNDSPVKYGLVDSIDAPGHNVTGVYQSGFYFESLILLKTLVPGVRTFALLTDDSPSGRAHQKAIEFLARQGELPMKLIATVSTNDYDVWKARALELQKRVDSFYVAQYSTLKDDMGAPVPGNEVARWYLKNIRVPEATQGQFVKQGLLCAADDSGYKQAYEAVSMAQDILIRHAKPATYPTRAPSRGALMVNGERIKALGLTLTPAMGIEEFIKGASALKDDRK